MSSRKLPAVTNIRGQLVAAEIRRLVGDEVPLDTKLCGPGVLCTPAEDDDGVSPPHVLSVTDHNGMIAHEFIEACRRACSFYSGLAAKAAARVQLDQIDRIVARTEELAAR